MWRWPCCMLQNLLGSKWKCFTHGSPVAVSLSTMWIKSGLLLRSRSRNSPCEFIVNQEQTCLLIYKYLTCWAWAPLFLKAKNVGSGDIKKGIMMRSMCRAAALNQYYHHQQEAGVKEVWCVENSVWVLGLIMYSDYANLKYSITWWSWCWA